MKYLILALIICYNFFSYSQLTENFEDGDISQNPEWIGNIDSFIINQNNELQLNANVSGFSFLSTPNSSITNTQWQFNIKINFSPSANNNISIFLVSNNYNLSDSLTGYFIKIGENLSNDGIDLYRKDGNSEIKIIDGIAGIASNGGLFTIKIIRTNTGEWQTYYNTNLTQNFIFNGSVIDTTYTNTNYFGVLCKYTASNISKFYFDNFYIGNIIYDTIPPIPKKIKIISENKLKLIFSEYLTQFSALNKNNYFINNNIGNPDSISFNNDTVILTFNTNFISSNNYTITLNNLSDLTGNIITNYTQTFSYYIVKPFDIVINEIMVNPKPCVYLPEAEYIELYNRSDNNILLHNWILNYGNNKTVIPDIKIIKDSFIILCNKQDTNLFNNYTNVFGLQNFSLNNNNEILSIIDNKNKIIHTINYDISWYKNKNKINGGWSLEQIDPNNFCEGYNNWQASISKKGGSPGKINSINNINTDNTYPEIIRAYISDTNSIVLTLSEPVIIDTISANIFFVNKNINSAKEIKSYTADNKRIKIIFSNNFIKNTIYTLSLLNFISDCAGNTIDKTKTIKFGYPEFVKSNNILINEVLFNPYSNGVDYVELYNNSNKIIDISELKIANKENNIIDNIKSISSDTILFLPKSYILISKNSRIIKQQYTTKTKYNFLNIKTLPAYPNNEGTVVILNKANIIIDEFEYNEEMHFPLLTNTKGVSLERISPNISSNSLNNWHSAAETIGFGTPGYVNSQNNNYFLENTVKVSLEKKIFSPNNDGIDDVLKINYSFKKSGYSANIFIFDINGRFIKQIANNELLATKGSFCWNGIDDYNQKIKVGVYILLFNAFNLKSEKEIFKLAFVVAP